MRGSRFTGVFFLYAGLCQAYQLAVMMAVYAGIRIYPHALFINGLMSLCLVLMGLWMILHRPLNRSFALLPGLYFLLEVLRILSFGSGVRKQLPANALNLLCWLLMAVICLVAAGSRQPLSPGKKALFFLPAILSWYGLASELRRGTYWLFLQPFDSRRIQSWVGLAPVALAMGFLYFALWAAVAVPAAQKTGKRGTAERTEPPVPTATEERIVRQYRGFLESGIITRAEFDAKMKSLRRK